VNFGDARGAAIGGGRDSSMAAIVDPSDPAERTSNVRCSSSRSPMWSAAVDQALYVVDADAEAFTGRCATVEYLSTSKTRYPL